MYKIVLSLLFTLCVFANTYEDAMKQYNKGEYKKALDMLKVLANNGDAVAQNDLGVMYEVGQGTNVNYKVSKIYYEKSAAQGNSDAQYNLGLIKKGQKKYREAVALFKLSAKQKNQWGEHYLGIMYQHGKGLKRSYAQAIKYYKRSISQGNYLSQSNLALMYEKGKGVNKNFLKAIELYTLSAKQDYFVAQYNLGMIYYLGKGVPQDKKKAQRLFQQSCNNGHRKGCSNLNLFKK
ncbi:MAG TPA: sel1 repeat family protein [Arcobacter sp.]|nr:sel1 repeat family protein [Arcobacter sp.]HIP56331.1 sel1 repeat family protein [Arcobacter sp.]